MNKAQFLIIVFVVCTLLGCKPTTKEKSQDVMEEDTTTTVVEPDSTLWGRLGEDTGMSVLQFITNRGDTLDIYRTNQYTGEEGKLIGDIHILKDVYAITLGADGESLSTAINVTQLTHDWKTLKGHLSIKQNGTIESQDMPYRSWQLWNGHILLTSIQKMEYGTVNRVDTMDIINLDYDSLIIRNHLNQIMKFGKV